MFMDNCWTFVKLAPQKNDSLSGAQESFTDEKHFLYLRSSLSYSLYTIRAFV